jgi:predicted regulator of Ras-like GTPase activity (Roadblock/LC7/MglB family)
VSQQMVNAKKGINKVVVALDKNINLINGVYVVTLDGDSIRYTPAKLVISKD